MFDQLNKYDKNSEFPFQKGLVTSSPYKFEWIEDLKTLQEAQRFRAVQFSQQFGIQFESGLDQDLYDFGCEHAVLRDKWSNEIVAYTRLKLFQGHELKQSYSQQEFKIVQAFSHLDNIVEIGRTCVHSRYRSGKALSVLWTNLLPKIVEEMRAKYLIGCVSIRMQGNESRAYYTHQHIKALPQQSICNIQSQQVFEPPYPQYSFQQDERIPKLFDVYLNMQAQLSTQAFYDEAFNCLDYFVYLEVNQLTKNFILQKKSELSLENA
ncbi:GNAT family N-acetyltransferase [Acinetobacter kookii]|uniref:L-ornithine N(alpha)-acyltransferase n=1 Tax=Acinetobacter kookii TaxID=1226327 RepID=A0A1G6KV57_9GAMM|nr:MULTISPECIES: GNAT family N-acetyltransferase [Acinetobacter]TCB69989.1 GNAT family N-acetyltransferase [Acinetobacter sp. ANC 4216]SDC34979.1 Putative hemolysin [Acinetobacter kookii]